MHPVILSFVGLLVSIPLITGCDDISRFSYENYSCQPRQSSIYEITISDLKKGKVNLPLKAQELEPALIEAEYLYADARCMGRDHPLCIDCIHHLVVKAECGLGMPEGRASGGLWAKDCAYFWEKKI